MEKTQAQEVIMNQGNVKFSPISTETFISKGNLYTCPDNSEVWEIFHPGKYNLPRYVENSPEVWEKLFG